MIKKPSIFPRFHGIYAFSCYDGLLVVAPEDRHGPAIIRERGDLPVHGAAEGTAHAQRHGHRPLAGAHWRPEARASALKGCQEF